MAHKQTKKEKFVKDGTREESRGKSPALKCFSYIFFTRAAATMSKSSFIFSCPTNIITMKN